jgi:hypothetical protein
LVAVMVNVLAAAAAAAAVEERCAADVDLVFADVDGVERREPLSVCWGTRFERAPPVRAFASYCGQRDFPGLWWFATTGEHVGFESWLERDHVIVMDFDRDVVALAAQPFWLVWPGGRGQRRHAPDFFARLADGTGVVVDVRADDRVEPADAEAFTVTARACRSVGWQFRRLGVVDAVLMANVRWLAGYRHPRCLHSVWAGALWEAFARPARLMDGCGRWATRSRCCRCCST